jgi:hypothetical protein
MEQEVEGITTIFIQKPAHNLLRRQIDRYGLHHKPPMQLFNRSALATGSGFVGH